MSYVAAVCGKGAEVNEVKEQLLQSNPVLEGKGCASVCLCGSKGLRECLLRLKQPTVFRILQLPGEVTEGRGRSPGHTLEEVSSTLAMLDFKYLTEGIANPWKRSFLA